MQRTTATFAISLLVLCVGGCGASYTWLGRHDWSALDDLPCMRGLSVRTNGLATAVDDAGEGWIWDLRSGKVLLTAADAVATTLSANGEVAAVADARGRIRVFRPSTNALLGELDTGIAGKYRWLCLSTSASLLAVAGPGNEAAVWDVHAGRKLVSASTAGPALAVALSEEDGLLFVGDLQGVSMWNVRSGACTGRLTAEKPKPVVRLALSGSSTVAATDADSAVHVWQWRTGALLFNTPPRSDIPARSSCFSPDGRLLAIVSESGNVSVHEVTTGSRIRTFFTCRGPFDDAVLTEEGHATVTVGPGHGWPRVFAIDPPLW